MGKMAIGWRSATEKLKPWTTKFMNLMIEWGRSCWTAKNGMIHGEKHQHYTLERKRAISKRSGEKEAQGKAPGSCEGRLKSL